MPAAAAKRGSSGTTAGTRTRIIVVAVAVLIVALIVGITVLATKSSSKPTPSHLAFRQLFDSAVVGQTKISVISQWPKPYQVYSAKPDECYEWYDSKVALYNLCFLNGVLHAKDLE